MKNWWHKLTIDWPCAIGDWLWAALVIAPARFLDRLTRRRILHVVGIIVLLLFFQYVVAFDLTFLFGIDLGLLIEVAAALLVITARDRGRPVLETVRRSLVPAKASALHVWRRGATRARRARRCRITRILKPPKSSDEDGLAGAFA
jgi:hypothetical protein